MNLFFILLFISCDNKTNSCDDEKVTELSFDSASFYSNKEKWELHKPKNYQFSYEIINGIRGYESIYVTSIVKDGKNVSYEYVVNDVMDEKHLKIYEELESDEKLCVDCFRLETIDDYISYLEEKYRELNSVDFEKEQFTKYCMEVFYNMEYFFPYEYRVIEVHKIQPVIPEGDYTGYNGGIKNFRILN